MKRLPAFLLFIGVATALAQAPDVPAFHKAGPAKDEKLPAILTQKQLAAGGFNYPAQKESYKAATKIPAILYQLPCYCHCDKGFGHTSLHTCFSTQHGANCGVCIQETLYAYWKSKAGWTVRRIREAIVRGDFKEIDLGNVKTVE